MKKIAIGTWAYIWGDYAGNPIPLADLAGRLRALQFDGIELAGFPPHMDPKEFSTPAKRKQVKRMLDDHGLAIASLTANFRETPPALVKPADYIKVVKTNLDICRDLDIPNLRVDTVSPAAEAPAGMELESCFWRIAQVWQRATDICANAGVRLVWEFESAFLFNKPSEIVRMLYAVDHPNFTALFDFYHAYMCGVLGARQTGRRETLPGGVVQFAHMLTGKIGLVHFSDCDSGEDEVQGIKGTRRPFGAGVIDFGQTIEAIEAAGYTGQWWSIDLGGYWPDALGKTAPAKQFMDDLVGRFGGD